MTQIPEERVTIDAPGARLAGVLSSVPNPELLVILSAATGVPAAFYRPFARWLAAEKSAAVLTWDYRDFGASGQPYRSTATMTDWAIHDSTAARDWLLARYPDLPLWVIGHSLGGMATAFQPANPRLSRIITVAAGHGHISDHPWPYKLFVWLLWYVLGPISATLLGYLPGRRLRLGHDLPKGVFWQWRRWMLDRRGLPGDPDLGGLSAPGFAGPLTIIAMQDDHMMPPSSAWKMAAWHPQAQIQTRLLIPSEFGLTALGHIRPFAARNAAVWPSLIAP